LSNKAKREVAEPSRGDMPCSRPARIGVPSRGRFRSAARRRVPIRDLAGAFFGGQPTLWRPPSRLR